MFLGWAATVNQVVIKEKKRGESGLIPNGETMKESLFPKGFKKPGD